MELLQGDEFLHLFKTFKREAFHLEVEDSYHTSGEAGPFQLFLDGQPDDFSWFEQWTSLVKEVTDSGKRMSRVRVVSVPHVDYQRWGLTVAPRNIAAGEEILYLPRHLIDPRDLSTDDWWLFDDERVVFSIFKPDGEGGGGAQTLDPAIVALCRDVRDQVWRQAIPYEQYVVSEYAQS